MPTNTPLLLLHVRMYKCILYSDHLCTSAMYVIRTVCAAPQKYNVDLALWGHHHSYQRTCPVAEKMCTEKGVTHVVIGMGGQGLSTNIWPKALTPKWIQVVDDHHHGFSEFTANASTLTFQYIRNVDEGVGDYFVLNKP